MQRNGAVVQVIKKFSDYLVESEREVFFTFGRMNPPTIGHGKVFDTLASKSGRADYKIYVSQTQDPKKDPLSYNDKVKHLRKMFPKHARNIMKDTGVKNVFDVASALYDQGYRNITMVVGEDRIREFDLLLNKYNGKKARHGFYNFQNINVISAGRRDPDATGVEGMSASKQRENAKQNDFVSFSQGVPRNMSDKDARKLFNDVRKGMGLNEQSNFRNHVELEPVSETRESYVQGELFDVGDMVAVKESEEVGIVSHLGANYVIVEMTGDRKVRKWLDAVELIEKKKDDDDEERKKKTRQDSDVKDMKGTQPKKYYSGVEKDKKDDRARHFKKGAKMDDDNPAAYKPAPGDKGAKTKPSKYTKAFKKMYDEDCWDGYKQVGMKKKGGKMVPDCVPEEGGAGDEGTDELRKNYQKSTPNQPVTEANYDKAVDGVIKIIMRKKREAGKGNKLGKLKHNIEYYAYQVIKSLNLKLDSRELARRVRDEMKMQGLTEDPVKDTRSRIEREKERDKVKHDRMLDRARTRKTRMKNRETE